MDADAHPRFRIVMLGVLSIFFMTAIFAVAPVVPAIDGNKATGSR